MQAEECSQGGLRCNKFCRTCHVGGNNEYKQSDEGYLSLFEVILIAIASRWVNVDLFIARASANTTGHSYGCPFASSARTTVRKPGEARCQ